MKQENKEGIFGTSLRLPIKLTALIMVFVFGLINFLTLKSVEVCVSCVAAIGGVLVANSYETHVKERGAQ
jgi:hypothetical protein